MKDSKSSGPMRESELMSKKNPPSLVNKAILLNFGIDMESVDAEAIPQLEEFCSLQSFRGFEPNEGKTVTFNLKEDDEEEPMT